MHDMLEISDPVGQNKSSIEGTSPFNSIISFIDS